MGEKTANKVSEAFQTELCLCSVVTEGSTQICWWCLQMQGARHDGTEAWQTGRAAIVQVEKNKVYCFWNAMNIS